ncbi:hypothetical protein RI845_05595 [Thalassotalea nanhaiensis]|uniref:DUF1294 domain-containing protein n=1 Tax=Thalassotalea nanhaiensis TaxID=3065648 RepID=A0ABY9TMJ2_9GAMM|nr:hypothetical protein RI845_05595 [Colwelliaceae bacterium SQ345]
MNNCFFVSLITMLICDAIGIYLLKKSHPKEHESLGSPVHYWTDANKMTYIIGYVGLFRFISLKDNKIKGILAIQAVTFWMCIAFLIYGIYSKLNI